MRCRNCDYSLWNLKARTCPECGAAFAPSEYEFTPQSVRFCCPHCDHPYHGTGAKGHLEPGSFRCLHCERAVTMDEMVLRPGLDVEEQLTSPDTMPWLDRRQRGRVHAWFQMIGKGLTAPGQLIAATPPHSALRQAWIFAVATTAVLLLAQGVIGGAFGIIQGYGAGWFRSWMPLGRRISPLYLITFPPGHIALAVLALWLWTLVAHGTLRMTGGTAFSYRRTCQALLFSAGAFVLCAVPGWGVYVGAAWWAVSAALMLRTGQRVNGVRAGFAAGVLPALAVIGVMCPLLLPRLWTPARTGWWTLTPDDPTYQTGMVTAGVLGYRYQHSGTGPGHAIELALSDAPRVPRVSAVATQSLFCNPGTKTTDVHIPVGEGTLRDFSKASRTEQLRLAAGILQNMPSRVVAHRLGDFVFTYHGAPVATHDGQLWMVVMLPDPDANGPPAPGDRVIIATLDSQFIQPTVAELPALLEAQNRYRATLMMPHLPDLTTVTYDHPAVSPP